MNEVNLIVAIGKDGAIGKNNQLIWALPGDLKRFKELTMGHPVIMGRKTWDSLPKKPLPGRRNIVITRQPDYKADGAEIADSIEKAIHLTAGESPFVIGGAEIYKEFLPYATRIFITKVDDLTPDADAWLDLSLDEAWQETDRSSDFTNREGINFRYITFSKNN